MLGLAVAAAVAAGVVPAPKQYRVEAGVFLGDPLGSPEAGTVKALAEPAVVVRAGRPVGFKWQKQVAVPEAARAGARARMETVGVELKVLPAPLPGGRVQVEVAVNARTVNEGRGLATPGGFAPGFNEQAWRTCWAGTPGKPIAIRLSADAPDDQKWVVVTVAEAGK